MAAQESRNIEQIVVLAPAGFLVRFERGQARLLLPRLSRCWLRPRVRRRRIIARSTDPGNALDQDHLEQAKRTKEPGWVDAELQLLLLPKPVEEAVLSWALR